MRKRAQTRKSGERVTREKLPKHAARFNGLSHDFGENERLFCPLSPRQPSRAGRIYPNFKMPKKNPDFLDGCIRTIRGQRVVLDADLARLYGVPTKRFNEAVKRNTKRFPADFAFRLTAEEAVRLRSQNATLESGPRNDRRGRHRKYSPWAFTEHGAVMAANVLRSARATAMSVYVVRAFVAQREALASQQAVLRRLAEIDKTLLEHDAALRTLWTKLRPLLSAPPEPPTKEMGFHVELRKKR